ncbi:MAG: hypothetical protein GX846_02275 [Deltaproteobacteria bacterium]|nr:hypothetical protein [Deltaproteobacteria bacterium]
MNDFTRIDRPVSLTGNTGGVWQIEKKRKARDRKGKQAKYQGKENKEGDETLAFTELELENADTEEFEDQTGYGSLKPKKALSTRIDLKI